MHHKTFFAIILALLLITGCRKNEDISDTIDIEYPTEIFINTSVKGTVKGSRGIPIPGAIVQIGSLIKSADFNGYFQFDNISARKSGDIIKVEKKGFRTSYKSFYPQKDGVIYVDIELESETGNIVVNTGDSDKKIGDEDISLEIIGNSFTSEGKDYSGNIMIKSLLAHPENNDFFENQLGDPVGYDKYYKTKGINSFGVIGIEMFQTGGQKIELGNNSTIELLIKNDNQAAPLELSVWKFNFEKKKWLETSIKAKLISLEGKTYYTAEVGSSGFYNFAQNFDVYEKELVIASSDGTKTQFMDVSITTHGLNYKISQRTSDNGKLITYLPVDNKSDIAIKINDKTITETISKVNNTISIPADHKLITVKGKLKDCDGNLIIKGYITIVSNKDTVFYNVDQSGSFICNIVDAKNEQKISWIASNTDIEINTFIHKATKSDLIDLGEIFVCNEPFAIVEFGVEKYIMELKMKDITGSTLAFEFIKENHKLELACLDFKGENKYDLNSFLFTFAYNESATKRLFPVGEFDITVDEYNKPGLIRGKIIGKARKNFDDETIKDLKIVYSVRLE